MSNEKINLIKKIYVPIVWTIFSIFVNFENAIWFYPATIFNALITICYIIFWILYVYKNQKDPIAIIIFFGISLASMVGSFIIFIHQYFNINPLTRPMLASLLGIFTPFSVLSIPFYGIRFFSEDNLLGLLTKCTLITVLWFLISAFTLYHYHKKSIR